MALGLLAALLVISANRSGPRHWLILGGLAVLSISVYSLIALDQIWMRRDFLTMLDITPGVANIRLFSDLAVGLMPLALVYVVAREAPSRTAALLSVPGLIVWWWLLFLTEARSGVLSLVLAMAVALWLFGRHAKVPVLLLGLPALPALAGWWWLNPLRLFQANKVLQGGEVFTRDITMTRNRLDQWQRALEQGWAHFPFGSGPMQYAGDPANRMGSAHNLFFNTAAEWGIPVALMLVALVGYGCWVILKRSKAMPAERKPLYGCLVMAFVGVMTNVQFAGAHIAPLSSLMMALAIGLVFAYRPTVMAISPASAVSRYHPGPALLWGGIMLVLAYLLYAGMDLYWLSLDSTMTCLREKHTMQLYPRFWAQGRLDCMRMVAPDHWLFWGWGK